MMNGDGQGASICLQAVKPEGETIEVMVATSDSCMVEHVTDAMELTVLQRYLDERCSKGKHNKETKTADIWLQGGDAAHAAADVTNSVSTVSTRKRTGAQRRYGGGGSRADGKVENRAAVASIIAVKHMCDTTERGDARTPRDDRRAAGGDEAAKAADGRARRRTVRSGGRCGSGAATCAG